MYKMYKNHWDEESEDENGSLNSSFWTDGEGEEEIERACYDEDTEQIKPSKQTQEKTVEVCSKAVKREITNNLTKQNEEEYTISVESPALSLLTSGYGTYRPDCSSQDELKGEDFRDDCTIVEFDRQSQEGNSEMRYGEEDDDYSVTNLDDGKKVIDMPITTYTGTHTLTETEDSKDPPEVAYCKNNYLHDRLNSLFYSDVRSRKGNMDKDHKPSFDVDYTGDGAVSGLEEQLGDLHVSMSANHDSELERTDTDSISDSFEADGLPSAFEAYIKGMVRSQSENDVRTRAKSFIRPLMDHPHARHLKKTDPVAKYFQYKQDWEMFKPPGQKERKALHWKIRDQLSYQPPPPKPRRIFVPNSYVVPTEKKRSALRWEVRHDLANGLLPPKVNYRL
ncbi:uncharacterized protein hyls1 isoform X1 [Osmerus mordax]|uniref:uncharacterized protein hyls1 isoform X1 n=1 Tax=Osmerus mordax TaxID=8014 RepID=UPI00350F0016